MTDKNRIQIVPGAKVAFAYGWDNYTGDVVSVKGNKALIQCHAPTKQFADIPGDAIVVLESPGVVTAAKKTAKPKAAKKTAPVKRKK